jgi:hypothetical protein
LLTYEPSPPLGAPSTLKRGEIAEFHAGEPFVVRSQDELHPFYLASYMTGGAAFDGAGDPEFVNVIPPAQYMSSYTFFTDPTYPETNLVIVRTRARDGEWKDVHLDCAGNVGDFEALGTSDRYEFSRIDLVRHNFENQGACSNGVHVIESDDEFGVTVWGWGTSETGTLASMGFPTQYVSYAYPAGAMVRAINSVVVPATPR